MKRLLPILAVFIAGCLSGEPGNEATIDPAAGIIYPAGFSLAGTLQCDQTRLSEQFDVAVNFVRLTDSIEQEDSCLVQLLIRDKTSHAVLDSLTLSSIFYNDDVFAGCDNARSYTTRHQADREIYNGYQGDIIVADLNFDHLDDIAVISDVGFTSNALYHYFVQTTGRKFVADTYLTDSVAYFPEKIDPLRQQLVTRVPAGVCCLGIHTYQLGNANRQWQQIAYETIGQ
ncbi:XAC2610-related protein [Paraflavitalea pollutisoli]|uniref:XAC2610-related protein n=1 Tax=Paraflavitalea pollutisoli TaxID=3034143 RepID=UPI0023EDDC62|nr:hypothetical protein [Paraflavitalea sp. H1-2-19X]